jgi:hypothetical protein
MRTPKQLIELADRLIEHGFKHGMHFSEAKHDQIRKTVYALFSKAADAQYGRGVFGAPHGAANESKYGYMNLKRVDKQKHKIDVDDYYGWSLEWTDHNTLYDCENDCEMSWDEYCYYIDTPGYECTSFFPCIRDLLVKLRPAA